MSIIDEIRVKSIKVCILESIGRVTLEMICAHDAAVQATAVALQIDKEKADEIVRGVEADIAKSWEMKKSTIGG